jgi:hypothetical protein
MIVSPIQPPHIRRADRNPAATGAEPQKPLPASAALVPVLAPSATAKPANSLGRPDPAFVAHLIAIAQQAPQTRTLRRATPEEAQARYLAQPIPAAARGLRMSKTI